MKIVYSKLFLICLFCAFLGTHVFGMNEVNQDKKFALMVLYFPNNKGNYDFGFYPCSACCFSEFINKAIRENETKNENEIKKIVIGCNKTRFDAYVFPVLESIAQGKDLSYETNKLMPHGDGILKIDFLLDLAYISHYLHITKDDMTIAELCVNNAIAVMDTLSYDKQQAKALKIKQSNALMINILFNTVQDRVDFLSTIQKMFFNRLVLKKQSTDSVFSVL